MFADVNALVYPKGYVPQKPQKLKELNLPEGLLEGVVLKRICSGNAVSVTEVSQTMKVTPAVALEVLDILEKQELIGVVGHAEKRGSDFTYLPKAKGKQRSEVDSRRNSYAAAAPVTLREYTAMVESQRSRSEINLPILEEAFSDIVVERSLLEKIGPSMINEGAVFFYGPPGTGKTSLAERMIKVYKDKVLIPYAIFAEGEIITVFDPSIHVPVDEQPEKMDSRWVLCERPAVVVGGELSAINLELQRDSVSGIYKAPIQLLANNGLLVVDDFGRQLLTPAELLNRWIVPLSRSIDFLALVNGIKFQTPFDAKVVFSTNLDPSTLGDEAFFRRIPNKVYIGEITPRAFDKILILVASAKGVAYTAATADMLKKLLIEKGSGDLRPYFPMDFIRIFKAISEFEDGTPDSENKPKHTPDGRLVMDEESILRIADIYFAQDVGGSWETAAG